MNGRNYFLTSILTGFLCLILFNSTAAQDDPLVLQQQAIKRIDAFVDHFRKTGDLKSRIPELVQADIELAESNRMLKARKEWSALALGLIKQGHVYRMQTQWQQAITLYQQAEDAAKRGRDMALQAEALAYRALAESSSHNLGRAIEDASQAVRLADAAGDKDILAQALGQLGTVQLKQGDLAGAADTLNRRVQVAEQAKDPSEMFYAYMDRSEVYLRIAEQCSGYQPSYERFYQALDINQADLLQAKDLAGKLGFAGLARLIDDFISSGKARRILIKKSEEFQKETIQKIEKLYHPKKPSDVLLSDKFVYASGPIPAVVTRLYNELKEKEKQSGGFADLGNFLGYEIEGQMNEMQGKNDDALAFYLNSVDSLERDRRDLRDERSRGTFVEDKIDVYYRAVRQLLDHHRYAEAFEILERSRSRALADLLAGRKVGLTGPKEQSLYAEMTVLRTRIGDAQSLLFETASRSDAAKNELKIGELRKLIRDLEVEHDKVLARMAKESPRLRNLAEAKPATLKALQHSMRKEGYEVLQYLVHESGVTLWHISPDSVFVRDVGLPHLLVAMKVDALRKSLESDGNAAFDEVTAQELFLFLIQPALSRINSERIVIISHGELNYIPFQILQDPADGRFLGERFQITYAPSASILLDFKRSSTLAGGRLLAVANPGIAFAGKEVQSISTLFPERNKVMADSLPLECDVKASVRDFDVIHLSVHAKFNAGEPMLSFIELGEGNEDDGKLTAAEMYGLSLDKNKLVVLSACETGKAAVTNGNESLGMIRGLLFAGAGSLLMSNWRVDSEATALWMQAFYENAITRPLSEAAKAALVRVKADPRYTHPRYWAAFMLIGR